MRTSRLQNTLEFNSKNLILRIENVAAILLVAISISFKECKSHTTQAGHGYRWPLTAFGLLFHSFFRHGCFYRLLFWPFSSDSHPTHSVRKVQRYCCWTICMSYLLWGTNHVRMYMIHTIGPRFKKKIENEISPNHIWCMKNSKRKEDKIYVVILWGRIACMSKMLPWLCGWIWQGVGHE